MNDEIVHFNFKLVPAHKPEDLHANMRSAIARGLPTVAGISPPNDMELSIVGGGPSIADTYRELRGYVCAINGSLAWLVEHGVIPDMCGVCDPSPHMADIVVADPRVSYFIASIVHPSVYDKLLAAGCHVYRWNMSSIPGGQQLLDEIEPDYHLIGGGSTMGLRWVTLGYTMGYRTFHLHGMDSSFRGKASHAYPDHQDAKDWIGFDGFMTRPNFIGQLVDFMSWLERLKEDDVDPVRIEVYGEGLLQTKFKMWKEHNADWHNGGTKPVYRSITADFKWPPGDKMAKASALADISYMDKFLSHIERRGTVVQAGGNVGIYPAHLAKHFREVHTFEPDPTNYALLAENLKTVKGTIAAHHCALGERDGTCGLKLLNPENTGMIQTVEGGDIPMRRLDTLGLPECDLIWLDVEGYELFALMGAEQTIEKYWPAVIIEDNGISERMGIPHNAATEWLYHRGYVNAIKYGHDRLMLPTAVPVGGITAESERAKYEKAWSRFPFYRTRSPGEGLVEVAIERLGMVPRESVTDFGCGPGRATKRFIDLGFDAMGIDIAANSLDAGIDVPFMQACLWQLPTILPAQWGFCCDVMEHIPPEHVDEVLQGIRKATRKGTFFQIAFADENHGRIMGERLHLTIRESQWWQYVLGRFWDSVEVVWLNDDLKANRGVFVCR